MNKIVTILKRNAERIAIFSIFAVVLVDTTLLFSVVIHSNKEERYEKVELIIEQQPESIKDSQDEAESQKEMTIYDETALAHISKMTQLDCSMMPGMAPVDLEQWYLEYKEVISEYEEYIDKPETIYDYYTKEELDLLFRVVQAEVGDEYSFEQKCNVASVIFNRLEHQRYPDEIKRVLIKRQFSTISDGRYKQVVVSEQTILACEYVFSIMNTAKDCLFFDSNGKLKYDCVFNDEAHNFYRLKGEKRMEEIRISLKTAESIRKFVQTTREFESDVDICVGDRAVLDAKSILGLYSIDLTRILTVRIMSDNEDEIKKFTEKMEEFASE